MPFLRLRTTPSLSRTFTSTSTRHRPVLPFPIIPKCPPPTCACAPTPKLEIDHTRPLSIPPYTSHIVIHTGHHDWPSRIEDSPTTHTWGALTAHLKRELGPKSSGFDPENPVLITTSSFSPGLSAGAGLNPNPDTDAWGSILLFPASQQHHLPGPRPSPTTLGQILRRMPFPLPSIPIKNPTILVCSHASRDSRCGTLGPLILSEFQTQLFNLGMTAHTTFPSSDAHSVNLGGISHVGGHAWAGNVIIYTPLEAENALAGTGIWLGRVEPKHVEGIIKETILGGRVIRELWRGGIGSDGRIMRI